MFFGFLARLVIDWTQMPTYNTIMSVAAGWRTGGAGTGATTSAGAGGAWRVT